MLKTKQHGVTAAGLSQLIGHSMMWSPQSGITFTCRIIDARVSWNRIDVLLEPTEGEGCVWVSAANVRGITDGGQKLLATIL